MPAARFVCEFLVVLVTLSIPAFAQEGPPPDGYGRPHDMSGPHLQGPPPRDGHLPPEGRMFPAGPPGKWWDNPTVVQHLGITADQQKKMEALFQQSRLHLIDLSANLQKQDAILDPLLDADQPDESKVLAQIDRIAQARAELEKANAKFLLGIRNILTPDQWRKLKNEQPPPPPGGRRGH